VKITVIGPGRAGTAISQHAAAAGLACVLTRSYDLECDVVLLAVPERVIAAVAAEVPLGPAVGMLSGAAPLALLHPHSRRFVLHPMQTIQPNRSDLQLLGCAAGITASDAELAALAADLACRLGMRPVDVPDEVRPLPHIACVLASNLLVAPLAAALAVLERAGLGPDAAELLGPLAERAVANALAAGPLAAPTGPLARGDRTTIEQHRATLARLDPALDEVYRLLSSAALPLVDPAAAAACAPALAASA